MFYRVQKGVKKGAPAGSVSGCGGGCGFPQPFCRTRTGVAVSRRCRAVPLRAALLLFRCVGWCGLLFCCAGAVPAQGVAGVPRRCFAGG